MIFDKSALPLLEKYKAARESEALATKALLAALESHAAESTISELSDQMTAAHSASMDIWEQLLPLALDK